MSDLTKRLRYDATLSRTTRDEHECKRAALAEEAADTITKQAAEIDRLMEALTRIATPAAFWVATSDVNPESLARMVYAECVRDGGTAEDAESLATVKAQERGEDNLLRILRQNALNKEPTT